MFDLRMLPHNPVAFFELKTGYDRRDLKRSYGLAIRQYSPEVHASEFQLVRDAYERLEKQLRYGKHQQERSDAANAWSFAKTNAEVTKSANANAPPTHPSPAMPAAPLSPQPQARELSVRQLAVIDPVAALQKLQSQSRRTPQDYYLAAVLADATAGKPTLQYLVQLLEGLASHPTDPGLNALVSEYLRYELPDAKLQNTVQFVAQKLRTAAFYMVTEPLWLRLVNLLPFEQWRSLLTNCEQQIHQTDLATRTTFYLRLLEPAIWVASSAWTDGVLQELERGAASLGHAVQQDLEFVAELHQLLSVHATGNRDDHVRATLLQVFRRACQSDEVVAQREIIDLFSQLGRDASAVQRAFPMSMTQDDDLWYVLVYRVLYRIDAFSAMPDTMSAERIVTQTVYLMNDLQPTEPQINQTVGNADWLYRYLPWAVWTIGGTCIGAAPITMGAIGISNRFDGMLLIIGISVLFVSLLGTFPHWIYPKFISKHYQASVRRRLATAYSKHWRARMFRFIQGSHDTIDVHFQRIESLGKQLQRSTLTETILTLISRDTGLKLFAAIRTVLQ